MDPSVYQEPLALLIPRPLLEDSRLNFVDKALWSYLVKLAREKEEKGTPKIAALFGITRRYVSKVKSKLARFGYLKKRPDSRGGFRYVAVDPALTAFEKIRAFLGVSNLFKTLTAADLFSLSVDADRLLYVMELYEYSYRASTKVVEKPFLLLKKGIKHLPSPDAGFVRGWWMDRVEAQERQRAAQKREREGLAEEKQRAEAEEKRIRELDLRIEQLIAIERDLLRAQAEQELKANGGVPELGGELLIRAKMRELLERGIKHGTVSGM